MKRIIDGVTYNTATAVEIACSRTDNDRHNQVNMYQTRKGAFFFCLYNSEGEAEYLQPDYEDPEKFVKQADEVYLNHFSLSLAETQQ
jgi:hypothetical protein